MKKLIALFLTLTMLLLSFAMTACDLGNTKDSKADGEEEVAVETFTIGGISYDLPEEYVQTVSADESADMQMNMHMRITTGSTVIATLEVAENCGLEDVIPADDELARTIAQQIAGVSAEGEEIVVSFPAVNHCVVKFQRDMSGEPVYHTVVLFAKMDGENCNFLKLVVAEKDESRPVAAGLNLR